LSIADCQLPLYRELAFLAELAIGSLDNPFWCLMHQNETRIPLEKTGFTSESCGTDPQSDPDDLTHATKMPVVVD